MNLSFTPTGPIARLLDLFKRLEDAEFFANHFREKSKKAEETCRTLDLRIQELITENVNLARERDEAITKKVECQVRNLQLADSLRAAQGRLAGYEKTAWETCSACIFGHRKNAAGSASTADTDFRDHNLGNGKEVANG